MTTVFTNAQFLSMNKDGDVYSVMVVSGKEIVYVGFSTPLCYDSERVVDLNGGYVVPLINDMVYYDISRARCKVLEAGQQADFIVVDKNVLKHDKTHIIEVYKKGRKRI